MRKIFVCIAALALSGCGLLGSGPKTHFYTLAALNDSDAAPAAALAHPITVAAVHIPPSLDRSAMVVHRGANAVGISGTDRWTGPLGPMIRRVLSEDLAAHLAPSSVILPDAPAPPDTNQIVVTVLHFGPVAGGNVVLDANWTVVGPAGDKPIVSRDVHFQEPQTGKDGDAIAAAMSRLLARLAGQMARILAPGS